MVVTFSGQTLDIKFKTFSGGEEQVLIKDDLIQHIKSYNNKPEDIKIKVSIKNSGDLVRLLMLKNALDNTYKNLDVVYHLSLGYIPYARQDRICNKGEAFSLKVFADLINSMNFKSVKVEDPHSDVSTALINNCVVVNQEHLILDLKHKNPEFAEFLKNAELVSPDAGSNKKMLKVCKTFGKKTFVRADKIRDVQTNDIIETVVFATELSGNFLIVDDICDGGRTFTSLAQALKAKGANKVGLYVTHGIFSNGIEFLLNNNIDYIFTPNNWLE